MSRHSDNEEWEMDAEGARIYLAAWDERLTDEQLTRLTDEQAVRRAAEHEARGMANGAETHVQKED